MKIYNFRLTLFVLSVVLSLALCQTDEASPRCPQNLPSTSLMTHFHNSCYQFVSEEKYWHDARNYCHRHHGRLVKIDDPQTNEFIVGQLNSLWWRNNGIWIGLHDIGSELEWHWTGFELHHSEEVLWTNWGRGHPRAFFHNQRDCVRMVRSDGWKWHETVCNALRWHYRFICEYRMLDTSSSHAVNGNVRLHRAPVSLNRESSGLDDRLVENANVGKGGSWKSSEVEASAAVQFNDEMTGNENRIHSPTAVLIAFGCLLVATLILVAMFMFNRRRRRLSTKPELDSIENSVGSKVKVSDDDLTEASSFRPSAVANIYVDADVNDRHVTSRLAFKTNPEANGVDSSDRMNEGDRSRSLVEKMESRGDGREEEEFSYDTPKSMNIYSEISDVNEDGCTENGHIYEALEDVRKYSENCA